MNKAVLKGLGIFVAFVAIILIFVGVSSLRPVADFSKKYEGYNLTVDVEGLNREGTYSGYLADHADAKRPSTAVDVNLTQYSEGEDVRVEKNYEGEAEVLFTGNDSTVSWKVNVPEAGFYNMYLEYIPVESRGVTIERSFLINGKNPFTDAANLTFARLWTDAAKPKVDNQGNEIRATQIEKYYWQSAYFRDDMGYVQDPYQFYFDKGENEITLVSVNEPMVLRKLTLTPVKDSVAYADYRKAQPASAANVSDFVRKVQGEEATLRSEPSLYARYDRSSPTTDPYSVTATILNYIGGDPWSQAGQWIEWEIEVPSDGFYNITVKARQNYARGSVSARCLYIDGEIPFEEAKEVAFDYDNDWQVVTLADEEGNPYEFYLTAGKHAIRLEATLGGIGPILEEMEDSTFRLNQIYRRILVYTGATPDSNRDYHVEKMYPEVITAMDLESRRLYKIVDDVVNYTGQKADKIASVQTLARDLEKFVDRPEKITQGFMGFKDSITAMGTTILNMSETKLDIDYIIVSGSGAEVPKDSANGFQKFVHEIKSFVASFIVDYDAVGDVYDDKDGEVVKVWIVTGRDQGSVLKTMVDDTFIPKTGVKVNVEIVDAGALLNAVVAGRGPNVVISVGADQPVNYALRNAAEDLRQFGDCDEVLQVFYPSAYRQYEYDGGLYAIPETQTYNVMFYRKDVLEQLELEVPETWDDLISLLPTIQGNNLTVGFPSPTNAQLPDLSLFYTLLYQLGGEVYDDPGMTTILDDEEGVKAFSRFTSFYTDYGLPTDYDFVSRFRSGEMPIGIANYTTYNTLVVAAPEIRGLWDFTLMPGMEKEDGTIDRSVFSNGTCTMMIRTKSQKLRENSWEFMKWWAQTDTQVRFGREMEALLGSSARYATANKYAFDQLSWSADDVEVLKEQWIHAVGFREVAGGYYTPRHVSNAVRKVINQKEDPRETLIDYAIKIDEELRKKRIEFGMEVD